jgi:transposase
LGVKADTLMLSLFLRREGISFKQRRWRCARASAAPRPLECSPDLNPIKLLFAKLKPLLRKADARSLEVICTSIVESLSRFSPRSAPTISRMPDMRHPKSGMF